MQNFMIEELETIAAPGELADFLTGLGAGIALGMLICGGA